MPAQPPLTADSRNAQLMGVSDMIWKAVRRHQHRHGWPDHIADEAHADCLAHLAVHVLPRWVPEQARWSTLCHASILNRLKDFDKARVVARRRTPQVMPHDVPDRRGHEVDRRVEQVADDFQAGRAGPRETSTKRLTHAQVASMTPAAIRRALGVSRTQSFQLRRRAAAAVEKWAEAVAADW